MKVSTLRDRRHRPLGADELLLILLLVFLATAAGSVKGPSYRTYLKTGELHTVDPDLAGAPAASQGLLDIIYDGGVLVQYADRSVQVASDVACGPPFEAALRSAAEKVLGTAEIPVNTVIHPRADTPICVYMDTLLALQPDPSSGRAALTSRIEIEAQVIKPGATK